MGCMPRLPASQCTMMVMLYVTYKEEASWFGVDLAKSVFQVPGATYGQLGDRTTGLLRQDSMSAPGRSDAMTDSRPQPTPAVAMALPLVLCSRYRYGKDGPLENHQLVPVPLNFCVRIAECVEMTKPSAGIVCDTGRLGLGQPQVIV